MLYTFFVIMNNQTIQTVTLVVVVVTLVLWLTGQFAKQWNSWQGAQPSNTVVVGTPPAPQQAPTPQPQPVQPTPAPAPSANADQWAYETFLETAYIKGNKDAKVSVIEFSDVQCPFCQRHTNNGTLDQVLEKYDDDVNVIFAHFPLWFHQNAQKAGEALECAGKAWWEEGFYAMKKAYFAKGWDSNMDLARASAQEAWLDADAVMDCVDSGEFAQKVKDQMAFGRSLWVTWTPGNIVMNNETLENTKVSWAVPASAFDSAISWYLQ